MRVKVTFYVEASDPDHDLGVSEEDYDRICTLVSRVSDGDAPDFEVER